MSQHRTTACLQHITHYTINRSALRMVIWQPTPQLLQLSITASKHDTFLTDGRQSSTVNTMIVKDTKNFKIHRLRPPSHPHIRIYEADFHLLLAIKCLPATFRPGCEAQSLTFLEGALIRHFFYTTRRTLFNFDNDAKRCYDLRPHHCFSCVFDQQEIRPPPQRRSRPLHNAQRRMIPPSNTNAAIPKNPTHTISRSLSTAVDKAAKTSEASDFSYIVNVIQRPPDSKANEK